MKRLRLSVLLPAAFLGLSASLPAFSVEREPASRAAPAGVLLAQRGDLDVFFDESGRRVLLNTRTGEVVAVEPRRRASGKVKPSAPGQLKAKPPGRRKEEPQSQLKAKQPAQEKVSAPGQLKTKPLARQKEKPQSRLKAKQPAQEKVSAVGRLKVKPPAPKKQQSAKRRTSDPAVAIEDPEPNIASPTYYDFQPEPLVSLDFAGLKPLAEPQPAAPRGEEAPIAMILNSWKSIELPAWTPQLMMFITGVGSSYAPTPLAQAAGTEARQAVENKADQSISPDQKQVTGSVQSLGYAYDSGKGVTPNDGKEGKEVRSAAEQGDAKAQLTLASMYRSGEGVPKDDIAAAKWFRMAAEQGNAGAQFSLGLMYQGGEGVLQDYVLAHMWFNLSAAQGYEDARKARTDVAERMTPDQVAEAQRLARQWKPASEAHVR